MANDIPDLEDAIEQLAESFGFNAHYDFKVKGEVYRITYRQFCPADVQKRLAEVEQSLEDCDKVKIEMPNGKTITRPELAEPLRRNGVLLPDSKDALMLIAMWGEDRYRAYESAGGPASMLTIVWARMDEDYAAWRRSKSTVSS